MNWFQSMKRKWEGYRENERHIRIMKRHYGVSREFAQAAIATYDSTAHISVEVWQQGKADLARRYPEEYARWMPEQFIP